MSKSTKNDFLQVSLLQYNQALDDIRDAWVTSANLPVGVKKELKSADHTQPGLSDKTNTKLPMLADQEIQILQEHQQMLKDQTFLRR